jgi:hypothetical protein
VHVHTAQAGDTLIGLGQRLLVDPARWPELQRLNQVRNPRRIPVGTPLRIPLHLMRTEAVDAQVVAVVGGARSGWRRAGRRPGAGRGQRAGDRRRRPRHGAPGRRHAAAAAWRQPGQRCPNHGACRAPTPPRRRRGWSRAASRCRPGRRPRASRAFASARRRACWGVRGTEFRVSVDAAVTRGEVLEGVVAVSGAAKRAGSRTTCGRRLRHRGRCQRPRGPAAGAAAWRPTCRRCRPCTSGRWCVCSAAGAAGCAGWRVQVARRRALRPVLLADVRSATPELRIAGLADGRYPMRLRAVDADGLEGRDARAARWC